LANYNTKKGHPQRDRVFRTADSPGRYLILSRFIFNLTDALEHLSSALL
jgi:hypothetical protein